MYSKLQYISQGNNAFEQEKNILYALQAGARWIQLRWKEANDDQLMDLAIRVQKLCMQYQAIFIINDHIYIAKVIDADGVHLGLTDSTILETRQLLGAHKIIGGTANTLADVQQRIAEKCDYIGLGPLRFTTTKENLSPVLGIEGYAHIINSLQNQDVQLPPIYAIGGIFLEDITALQTVGVYGVALSTLITKQPNLVQKLKNKLQCIY
ncbi:thiamine phosphate synthase [Sphingobacterium sp. SRCM116780]|uniref:thiamine phosphate synthase n=1 Tax=Sphingobacterium sp. SRCM116780 TaxID=2907623 RepID=UPI001F2EC741|nr:thiamine phosphate synthase [Sphingobacterium sp. SRCM116780]UIR56898.1 thiamine phosphate synthase [Sphingobacterium sp. SRCM116780]